MNFPENGLPPYRYHCDDRSLLLPYLNRFVLDPITPWVPLSIHPNWITTAGFVSSGLCLLSTFLFPQHSIAGGILGGLFILLYLVLDNFDGKQAKRTVGGSARGEFFDHYLDAFTSGMLLLALHLRIGFPNPDMLVWLMAGVYLVTSSVSWYQKQTGKLFFGKFSPFEAAVLLASLFFLSAFLNLNDLLNQLSETQRFWLAILFGLSMIREAGIYLYKTGFLNTHMVVHLGLLLFIPLFPLYEATYWKTALLIGYGTAFTGKLLFAHLTGQKNPSPDVLPVAVILISAFLFPEKAVWIGSFGAVALILLASYRFLHGAKLLNRV